MPAMSDQFEQPLRAAEMGLTGTATGAGSWTLPQVRAIVAGTQGGMSRASAMALLLASNWPTKHRDFEAVLRNDRELPQVRYAAAIHLGKTGSPGALEVLVDASGLSDERVLAGVAKALGWIGDREDALARVRHIRDTAAGPASKPSGFAALLIAHRLGLQPDRAPVPANLLPMPSGKARHLHLRVADPDEVELCLSSLADQPLAMELVERPMYQLRCEDQVRMVLLSRRWVEAGQTTAAQSSVPAIVALKMPESGKYSLSMFVLLSHGRSADAAQLALWRTTGDLIYSGPARFTDEGLAFSLATAFRPGARPVEVEGELAGSVLRVNTAVSAHGAVPKSQPTKHETSSL
jgi:HEAT repeats